MNFKKFSIILVFITCIFSATLFIQSSSAFTNQYAMPTSQNPFVRSEVMGASGVQSCQVTVTKYDTLFVWVGDDSGTAPTTINDSIGNSWTGVPSASAGTYLKVTQSLDSFYTVTQEEYVYFAYNLVGNSTDTFTLATKPSSTSVLYCADIGAENATGWETLPTQPISVKLNQYAVGNSFFNGNTYAKIPMPANYSGYSNGLQYGLMFGLDASQQPSLTIQPSGQWVNGCINGVVGSCRWISLNAGSSSWNGNVVNEIGTMNPSQNIFTISQNQNNCANNDCASLNVDALVSFPNVGNCIYGFTCANGNKITPNPPNNYNFSTYINLSITPLIFIILPTLLFGFAGLYFKAGIYGYVFGEIIGAVIGVYSGALNIWIFLVSLYGALALLYVSNNSTDNTEIGETL